MRQVLLAGLVLIALGGCGSRQSEGVFLTSAVILTQQRQAVSEADARSRVNRDNASHYKEPH